jgi:pimeloyl-ACP methyl ester carboxylesterase
LSARGSPRCFRRAGRRRRTQLTLVENKAVLHFLTTSTGNLLAAETTTSNNCGAKSLEVVAVANLPHSVTGDAAYVRDVIAGIGKPVVLVGHSYGAW